jgi:hypothetical protein
MEFISNYLGAMQYLTTSEKEISKNGPGLIRDNLALDSYLQLVNNFRCGGSIVPLRLISSGTWDRASETFTAKMVLGYCMFFVFVF